MYNPNPLNKKYLLIIGVIIISCWAIALSAIKQIPRDQILHVFIDSDYVDKDSLQTSLIEHYHEDHIKKVEFTVISSSNTYFNQTLLTTGVLESDILILSDDYLSTFNLGENFYALNDWLDLSEIQHGRLMIQSDVIYGVKLIDDVKIDYQWMCEFDLYVFANKESIHNQNDLLKFVQFFV